MLYSQRWLKHMSSNSQIFIVQCRPLQEVEGALGDQVAAQLQDYIWLQGGPAGPVQQHLIKLVHHCHLLCRQL